MQSSGSCGLGSRRVACATAVAACLAAIASPGSPAAASADPPAAAATSEARAFAAAPRLRFAQPPLSSKSLWVKWRADHARKKGRVYTMELRLSGGSSDLCSRNRLWTIRRPWNKNDIVSVRLKPLDRTLGEQSLWCPGPATLRVVSTAPGNRRKTHALLKFKMPSDPAHPVQSGTPVEINLLEGSTITVQVAGRPDRTSTLTGQFTGQIPGRFDDARDAAMEFSGGSLSVESLDSDLSCTASGRAYPNPIALAPSGTSGTLYADNRVTLKLQLAEHPVAMTGCTGPAAADAGTIELSGRSTDGGLTRIELSATVSGVRLSEGVDATLQLKVVIGIELSQT
jgi:hypothetical protein